jgi:ankyrin repeat protein
MSLIEQSRGINSADSNGMAALMYAVRGGYLLIADRLIRGGADIDASDREGNTSSHHLYLYKLPPNEVQKLEYLLRYHEADVTKKNQQGVNPWP